MKCLTRRELFIEMFSKDKLKDGMRAWMDFKESAGASFQDAGPKTEMKKSNKQLFETVKRLNMNNPYGKEG